jgi:type VI secretion system protein ImpA
MSEAVTREVTPVLDVDRLLAPVRPDAPAGDDVRYDGAFDKLKNLRREAEAIELGPREAGEEANGRNSAILASWAQIADQAVDILAGRSKDLQVALWLLEALSRLEGFRGAMTGLRVLSGFVETYWDGFYPQPDPEDDEPLGFRVGLMTWLDERLPTVLKTAPVCAPPDSYGLLHYEATQKTGDERKALIADGWPTTEQFDAALKASSLEWLEEAVSDIAACRGALETLTVLTDQKFVSRRTLPNGQERVDTLLSFVRLRDQLETAYWLVDKTAKPKRPVTVAAPAAGAAPDAPSTDGAGGAATAVVIGGDGGWLQARDLVRQNQVEGLRVLQARLREAGSGRDRFLRKLEFADVCREAGVHALAFPLYEDVTRTIADRSLIDWEDRELLMRAWKGLAECCDRLKELMPAAQARGAEATEQIRILSERPR